MRGSDILLYAVLGGAVYWLISKSAEASQPPLPQPEFPLVPEPASMVSTIPLMRGSILEGLGCNCNQGVVQWNQ